MRGWHKRVLKILCEPACHSDDEDAPDGKLFRLRMEARSNKATSFLHNIDEYGAMVDRATKRKNSNRKVVRIDHPDGKVSEARLPSEAVALDWFDPAVFNELPAVVRAKYRKSPIALPSAKKMEKKEDWKTMETKQFMEKYGNRVRALYHFPTKVEREAMKQGGIGDTDEEMDSSGSEDGDDGDDGDNNGEDLIDLDYEPMEEDGEGSGGSGGGGGGDDDEEEDF